MTSPPLLTPTFVDLGGWIHIKYGTTHHEIQRLRHTYQTYQINLVEV
jgi:hypothetical protein